MNNINSALLKRKIDNEKISIFLKNLLNQLSKGRVCIDSAQELKISLSVKGDDREFNRMVNSLSRELGLAQAQVEKRSMIIHGVPGIINKAKLNLSNMTVEICHASAS